MGWDGMGSDVVGRVGLDRIKMRQNECVETS